MIHKEGYKIISVLFLLLLSVNITLFLLGDSKLVTTSSIVLSIALLLFVLRFFRVPNRKVQAEKNTIFSPADGKVVVVEETLEDEYFKTKMIQVSIFMSVWNVHINWFPCDGEIKLYRYHPGKYLLARHPKSSSLNERNTLVLRTEQGKEILLRQIAGYVARRVISYASSKNKASSGEEMGFIKFGSRVDIFLPLGTEILVKPGQEVKGRIDKIALL